MEAAMEQHTQRIRQAAQEIQSPAFWRFAEWFLTLENDAAEQREAGNLLRGAVLGDRRECFLTDTQGNVAQVEALLKQITAAIGGSHSAECKIVQVQAVKLVLDKEARKN
jgi:hypothetical protein